jgi:Kef-type K+ transport system membrane component KefB
VSGNEFSTHDSVVFMFQIAVMLATGLVFGEFMRRLNQPAVLGELIGGVLLGPTLLGLLWPQLYGSLFPVDGPTAQARDAVIRFGMLFFLFVAGLEVKLSQVRERSRSVVLVSLLGFLFPFGLGMASVLLFPDLWGPAASERIPVFAVFAGTALSISALPVITRILMDLGLLHSELGATVMASATVNDLLGWSLFAFLLGSLSTPMLGGGIGSILGLTILFSLLVLAFGRWIGRPLLRWARKALLWPSGFLGMSAVLILISAAAAEALHIHAVFGAFLIGVSLNRVFERREATRAKEIIRQFSVSFFAPLYFVSIGLKTNFLTNFDLPLALVVVGLAVVGKVGGAGLGAWLSGSGRRDALAVGFAMNARGAMEMILASVALEYGLIDQSVFVALVTMALVTSMLSGPALQRLLSRPKPRERGRRWWRRQGAKQAPGAGVG